MQLFTQTSTFAVLLCTLSAKLASSADSSPFLGRLDPWQVSRLEITAPAPGRDGPLNIDLDIANPNNVSAGPIPHGDGGGYLAFGPSSASCIAIEETIRNSSGSLGRGQIHDNCTGTTSQSYGVWSVDLYPKNATRGSARTVNPANLQLTFTLNYNISRYGEYLYKRYEGTGRFKLGENLDRHCFAKNQTCSYALKANSTPVLVPQRLMACQGTCSLPSTSASPST
ncbi:uncharacterized protein F4822DRAFT_444175 [Hypoxylon trugodes]|uniref:uncharacterized protein n=1 Tax=Hypoxylon trugodes TaxID=326681 RepID=UPI00218E8B64|nr:uncharacterized protein F4822DRAFT_444175 [Hypoxylon trugodes]KAI1387483.1 hypothetical protein F4822DRAFT_444175 [Hypoxylon trugodes]